MFANTYWEQTDIAVLLTNKTDVQNMNRSPLT